MAAAAAAAASATGGSDIGGGGGIGSSASAAVAALRGGADGDTQPFGDGSVVIGVKRARPSSLHDSADQLL